MPPLRRLQPPETTHVGALVREARIRLPVPASECQRSAIAPLLNMTPTKLVRVEEGKRPLTLVEAIHVTRALNVGWGELIEAATLDALTTTGHSPAPNSKPVKHEILTEREQQILDLVSEDLGNAEIAQRLHLTVATVKYHVSRILLKLNVNSRVQAARWRT